MTSSTDSRSVEDVFQAEGNAVQRASVVAGRHVAVGLCRLFKRALGGEGDEGVEVGLVFINTGKTGLYEFGRGQASSCNLGGCFGDGCQRRIGSVGTHALLPGRSC